MFLPENIKKYKNVNIVSYKKYGTKYEIAIHPNKLLEFKSSQITLPELLLSNQIYINISKGETCPDFLLIPFNKSKEEIILEILTYGVEQKASKTRNAELLQIENEILFFLQRKLLYKNRFLGTNYLKKMLSCTQISTENAKVQAQDLIKKLCLAGFDKLEMKVEVVGFKDKVLMGYEVIEGTVCLQSEDFPKFRNFLLENKIKFKIIKNVFGESEEIV